MEYGFKGGDEVNLINKGVNYGWLVIIYGIDYSGEVISDKIYKEGMVQLWLYWDFFIVLSGMVFYIGDMFLEWEGDLLVGLLKFIYLRWVEVNNGQFVDQYEYLCDNGE